MAKTKENGVLGKAKKAAVDFDRIIHQGRERKQNEALAQQIFSRNRRQSAPSSMTLGSPSLASRVGVKKRVASSTFGGARNGPVPAAFTGTANGNNTRARDTAAAPLRGGLAARISGPGQKRSPLATAATATGRPTQRQQQLAAALGRTDSGSIKVRAAAGRGGRLGGGGGGGDQQAAARLLQRQREIAAASGAAAAAGGSSDKDMDGGEMSIRGLAGPFSVYAQNFAPGTSAADVENAFTPVGGQLVKCVLLKESPFVLVEAVFASREGGMKTIEQFNGLKADGHILKVYPNPGGSRAATASASAFSSSALSSRTAPAQIVDGTRGFAEGGEGPVGDDGYYNDSGRLYSDSMVGSGQRGRSFRGDWRS